MLSTPLAHPLAPHHLKHGDPTDSNCMHLGPFTCGTFGHQRPPSCSVGWPKCQEGHIHPASSPLSQCHWLPRPSSHQPCCMLHAVAQRPCGTRLQHPLPRMTSLENFPFQPPCLAIPLPHSSSRESASHVHSLAGSAAADSHTEMGSKSPAGMARSLLRDPACPSNLLPSLITSPTSPGSGFALRKSGSRVKPTSTPIKPPSCFHFTAGAV